jgi:hypothetical protein
MYAILSPRVLMRDLAIDRERADALLAELERRGVVGPTVIKGTGARESLVNVVEDRPVGGIAIAGPDQAAGRRVVLVAGLCALVGLVVVGGLTRLQVGEVVNRWLSVAVGSPILAAVIRSTLPSIGLIVGYLLEAPLRRAEDLAPYWAIRARGWIWSAATLGVVLLAVLRLLS